MKVIILISSMGIGFLIPIFFVFIDLYQIGEKITYANVQWTITSQNSLLYSFALFPILTWLIGYFFLRMKRSTKNLIKANLQIYLEQQKATEAQRLASIGEMAAGIAHEINNPLAVIRGYNSLIKKGHLKNDYSKLEEQVDISLKAVSKATDIISVLREVSRQDTNDSLIKISLNEALNEEITAVHVDSDKMNIKLTLDCADQLYVMARKTELSQVISNSIKNAIDAIADLDNRWISITAKEIDQNVIIDIVDSGPGISQKLEKKIFQPFFTTKPPGKGTGLGLSLSRTLIERIEGKLEYVREEHTHFRITLLKG